MKEGTLIEAHLKYMKELTDKLAAIGGAISEEDQVVTLLGSLPQSYFTLVTALEAHAGDIKLDFVQQALIHVEQKLKQSNAVLPGGQEDAALMGRLRKPLSCRIQDVFTVSSRGIFVEIVQNEGNRTMAKQCTKRRLQKKNSLKNSM